MSKREKERVLTRSVLVLLLVPLLAACVPRTDAETSPPLARLSADKAQPRLALLSHILSAYYASGIAARPTTCVSISKDGTEHALPKGEEAELMMRYPPLAPRARCQWGKDGWSDSFTGKPAMVFMLYDFACSNPDRCTSMASYTAGKTVAMSYRYTMRWDDGRWHFTRDARLVAGR